MACLYDAAKLFSCITKKFESKQTNLQNFDDINLKRY